VYFSVVTEARIRICDGAPMRWLGIPFPRSVSNSSVETQYIIRGGDTHRNRRKPYSLLRKNKGTTHAAAVMVDLTPSARFRFQMAWNIGEFEARMLFGNGTSEAIIASSAQPLYLSMPSLTCGVVSKIGAG